MSTDVAVAAPAGEIAPFQASWDAQLVAEQTLVHRVIKFVILSTPLFMAIFIGLLALAIGDQQDWYVFVALGAGLGVVAACLFGLLAGVVMNAELLEEVEYEHHRTA